MRITRFDPADDGVARACYDVHVAAQAVDDPIEPPLSLAAFRHWVTRGWNCNPTEVWVAADEVTGETAGFCRIELPDKENRDHSHGGPVVRPADRRRGIGSALLRHAVERARANGRTRFGGEPLVDSAGDAFARQTGAKAGLIEARRILDLGKVPSGKFARLRAEAEGKAAGYALVSWAGPTPAEHLDRVAAAFNAMNDAPHEPEREDNVWDAERVRERADAPVADGTLRGYSVAAVADSDGELAGLTQVFLDPEIPHWGFQGVTAVTRAHRGHRLGLLTKTAMLEWLAEAEPKLERISTGNAASNSYMISVNETLGYELAGPGWQAYYLQVSPD
jgi:GNAT superfamily N-acetyltransferase